MKKIHLAVILAVASTTLVAGTPQNNKKNPPAPAAAAADEEEAEDPDLPPGMAGKVDKEDYLRLRADEVDLRRGISTDPNAGARRAAAIREMESQEKAHRAAYGPNTVLPTWTPLGPFPIPNGQTSATRVNVSGRTPAIAVHPTDPDTVYVGTANGGLYKSTNGGAVWTALFESTLESLAIGSVTIDPTDSSIVYVGTGESGFSADSAAGKGLYIIRNANTSPTLNGPFRLNGAAADVFSGRAISKIVVDPTNNNNMLLCTTSGVGGNPSVVAATVLPNRGIYRSTNAQAATPTFEQIPIGTITVPYNLNVVDLALDYDGVSTQTLLATVIGVAGTDGGVWRTQNPWAVTPTFARTLAMGNGLRAELSLVRNGAALLAYVASAEISSAALGGPACAATTAGLVRKSTDGGATWAAAPGVLSTGFCGGQCSYDIAIAATNDGTTVHLGGSARGATTGSCRSDVMKRSTDGGANFARNDVTLHADSHALAIAPSNQSVVYAGNDGGIWRSTDNGNTWLTLNNSTFSATQFQGLSVHPVNRNFTIGGTQDNGTNCLRADGVTWDHCRDGDGGYALIDRNSVSATTPTLYHTFFNQANNQIALERTSSTALDGTGQYTWTFRGCSGTVTNNGTGCANTVLFYMPMALGPGNPNTLYYGTDRLYRSTDRADTMTVVSQPGVTTGAGALAPGVPLTTIAISPQDDNVRAVGTRNGKIFATRTGSSTLLDVTSPSFPPPNPLDAANRNAIGRIAIDPNNKFTAYATLLWYGIPAGQHVWKTTNLADPSGTTWTASGTGIPDVPVNSIVVDPQDSLSVYAATDIGVYASTDGGLNWAPFGTGLPRVPVFDVAIQNLHRVLRIATHGRGMYETTIPGTLLPFLTPGAITLVGESCPTPNGIIDPGETATVSFTVSNGGAGPPNNLVVTLLATGGVTNPSGPVVYGAVPVNGSTTQNFTFTNNASCGGSITLTFLLQDGATSYPSGTATFVIGTNTDLAPTVTENFDSVTAPTLPAGWTTSNAFFAPGTVPAPLWVTTTTTPDSGPNAAFGAGLGTPASTTLTSPSFAIPSPPGVGSLATVRLAFRNNYDTEGGYDGAVLEININGGGWQDIIAAGGSFYSGGYTLTIDAGNPLGARPAWSGFSNGYITTAVNLPPAAFGQNAQFRWIMACDNGTASVGIRIDSLSIYPSSYICSNPAPAAITGSTSVIAGDGDNDSDLFPGYTYSQPALGGVTYTWSVSAGAYIISGQGTPKLRVFFDDNAGPFTISAIADNQCGTTTNTLSGITKSTVSFNYDFVGTGAAPSWTNHNGVFAQDGGGPGAGSFADTTSAANVSQYESASYARNYGDFTYTVNMIATRPTEPSASNGIFVRGIPTPFGTSKLWNSGFIFQVSMNNKFSVYRLTGGAPTVLQAWTTPVGTTIAGSGLPNTLQVIASGGNMTFLINGVAVKTITGQTILSGRNGVGMVRSKPNPISGDSLKILSAITSTSATSVKVPPVSAAQEAANAAANRKQRSESPLFDDLKKGNSDH